MPPWAAFEWLRTGCTLVTTATSAPPRTPSTAARRPASPAPIINRSCSYNFRVLSRDLLAGRAYCASIAGLWNSNAKSNAAIDLASDMRPLCSRPRYVFERRFDDVQVLVNVLRQGIVRQAGRQVGVHVFIAPSRRNPELADLANSRRTVARLFPQFPLHGLGGVLARVERSRGGFKQDPLVGWRHCSTNRTAPRLVHRNDDYGTWVFDDLTLSRLAIANLNGVDAQGEDLSVVYPA